MAVTEICRVAIRDERSKFKRLNQFWALVYGVSISLAVASIVLIISVFWGNDPTTAAGGIATVASGGGLVWVITQRDRAAKDHEAAKQTVRQDCAPAAPATGGLESAAVSGDGDDGLDDATINALTSD